MTVSTKKDEIAEGETTFAVAEPLPSGVIATVFKESKDQKCGIRFRQKSPDDPITILSLAEDGLFANTDLRIGMQVVSVNGTDVDGFTRRKAMNLLKHAEGELTVVAQFVAASVVATVFKESKDQKCGIHFRQKSPDDPITISSLAEDGLFANTDLRIGMQVVSINGTDVDGFTRRKAMKLLKHTEGELTVVAQSVAADFIATVFKESKDQKCGIGFRQNSPDDPITISSLAEDGLFANTDLRIGMQVVSLNGTDVAGFTKNKAIQFVRGAVGELTVVAQPVAGGAVAVVFKESKDQKCGISLKQDHPSDAVSIARISSDGLFADSGLEVGMQVMSINNVAVENLTNHQAVDVLKEAEGKLTVVGQPYVDTPALKSSSNAPPGVADGGIWGKNRYVGEQTQMLMCLACLCCGIPGLCVGFCPQDERDAYRLGSRIYDAGGMVLGDIPKVNFVPSRQINAPPEQAGMRR
eukprot:scaffold345_cov134-Cylindrotheca_fusiformis.AAC.87